MIPANRVRAALLAAVLGAFPGPATADDTQLQVKRRAVLIATIDARCDRCAWDVEGREAVTLVLTLNGRYSQHLPLVRSGQAEYKVLVGTVDPGTHVLKVAVDRDTTSRELRSADAASARVVNLQAVLEDDSQFEALTFAPILHARTNAVGRFTDVPVFMWYEREPTPRGVRYRYSVIFTNEDGGTPADRLMATWGRTTDIEYVYSVEVDAAGKVLADDIQGPDHEILAFHGTRESQHPLLWVSTDNNMVLGTGTTRIRYAPAPVAFPLDGVSREAVMDANPWLYAVAAQELAREGKIVENAAPGKGVIPDPRRFVYVEGCGEVGNAALAFEVAARDTWVGSDRGVAQYRIVRDGCFRAAVPVPADITPGDVRGIRVLVYMRPPRKGEPGLAPEPVRLDRINTVFMLDEKHRPGRPLLKWKGPTEISVAAPLELPILKE